MCFGEKNWQRLILWRTKQNVRLENQTICQSELSDDNNRCYRIFLCELQTTEKGQIRTCSKGLSSQCTSIKRSEIKNMAVTDDIGSNGLSTDTVTHTHVGSRGSMDDELMVEWWWWPRGRHYRQ